MNKYKNKYRISSVHLQNWNYGWNAAYFVIICTHNRQDFFCEIVDSEMVLSEIGEMANKYWLEIPNHFSFVKLGSFVIMPNHVYGIIIIDKPKNGENENVNDIVETRKCHISTNIGQNRFQNQGKNTLSSIIGSYKSVVTKNACTINPAFAWQRNYYEHITRDDKSFYRISQYIKNNPLNWKRDNYGH